MFSAKYAEYLNMPEEGIFSLLVQEFNISIYPLYKPEYALHFKKDAPDAAIHHAIGQPKFWNGLHNKKWDIYYEEWLKMGGSRYMMSIDERLAYVRRYINRIKRKMHEKSRMVDG